MNYNGEIASEVTGEIGGELLPLIWQVISGGYQ